MLTKIGTIARVLPVSGRGLWLVVVGLLLVAWLLNTPPGLLGKADALGYAVCHRIDGRSFHLDGRQTPLCARCSGMYLGAVLGLGVQMWVSRRRAGMPALRLWIILGLFVISFGVDGLNSYFHLIPGAPGLYEPTNLGRLITGTGMGLVVAFVIFPAFNQTAWKSPDMTPALTGAGMLSLVVALALLVDWLVWIENPFLLYLFSLISAAGVLVLLTMVYTVFWLILLKSDNRLETIRQLLLPLGLGFGTALLQVALLDLARFALTGTWDGFHLG